MSPAREEAFPGFWRAIEDVVPGMSGVELCPTGGESVGGLVVVLAPTFALGASDEEAVVALYRARFTLGESTAYSGWSGEAAATCARAYGEWRAPMIPPAPENTPAFVAWLRGRGEEVLAAQRDGSVARHAPRFLDLGVGAPAAPNAVPTDLSEVTLGNLVLALDDRWNSPAGLFRTSTTTLLVEWWTSA